MRHKTLVLVILLLVMSVTLLPATASAFNAAQSLVGQASAQVTKSDDGFKEIEPIHIGGSGNGTR